MAAASLPVIDVAPLVTGRGDLAAVARALGRACREAGFFYAVGHGVDEALADRLEALARAFFARPEAEKASIAMARGGRAWRGWFPVGGELTSGRPDQKEGIYFGAELPPDHPRVRAGVPLHGPNLIPEVPGFAEALHAYLEAMTRLGHALCRGLSLSLDLPESWFDARYTREPVILFRIFRYPPLPPDAGGDEPLWSVAEHTDYGLLTMLRQDDAGGLEVRGPRGWIDAPPLAGSFVCNIGDMLDRMTGGLYRSTPHRVRNASGRARVSMPFFFDPGWDAEVAPIRPGAAAADDRADRWDGASVHEPSGTYGDYLLAKVSRVFPELGREVL